MSLNEEGIMVHYHPESSHIAGANNNDNSNEDMMLMSAQGGEHYTLNEVSDPMLDNSNPFREKSVKSYINSPAKN